MLFRSFHVALIATFGSRPILALLLLIAVCGTITVPVVGQIDPETRPATQDLLPETTVAFIQIDDFRDMMMKIQEGTMANLLRDESIAPLVDGLWDEARNAYGDIEGTVGVSLEDFQALPSGEMTFAVIAPRRKNLEYMLILELDDETDALDNVLNRGRQVLEENAGAEFDSEESDDGIVFEGFNVDGNHFTFFRKDGLIVASSSKDELDMFIDRWMEREDEKVRPLSANRNFITIMNRCVGSNELKPEARFYVDPISVAKAATRGNFAAQAGLAFLPLVGLDGLLGIGGSMILSEDEFESVVHGHIRLANPRSGIFEMIAFKPTQYEPEPWLPADITTYMTTSWDINQMLTELTKMIEAFQGEDVVDNWIEENINQEIDLDLKEDILAHLTGRVTFAQWLERPIKVNSQVPLIALELGNVKAFEESMEAVIARFNRGDAEEGEEDENENGLVATEYKGITIWAPSMDEVKDQFEERREQRRERRADRGQEEVVDVDINIPQPSFAIVGNYLLISPQSIKFTEHAIDTFKNDADPLIDDKKFHTVAEKMTRLLKTDMPCAMMYSNPEESMRMMFELIKSENSRQFLDGQSENNKYLAGIKKQLDDNPLPDFETLKKYFQASGGYMTTDDTGYHFLAFGLRYKPDSEDDK